MRVDKLELASHFTLFRWSWKSPYRSALFLLSKES